MSELENHLSGKKLSEGLKNAESHAAWHRYDEIPKKVLNDPDTIFLNLSGGWQTPPDWIHQAGHDALDEGFLKIQPVPEFNKAVAEKFHNDFGVDVNPVTEVIPCNGAGDGFFATLSVLLNPGDEVITFDPGYTLSYLVPTYLGARVRTIPLANGSDWIPDIDAVELRLQKLLNPRTRVFILVNPDNPSGHVFRRELLARIGKRLRQQGVVILEDQVYEMVIYPPNEFVSMISIANMRENTVCVSSFAKSYLCAGMKAGYIVAPATIIKAIRHYYMLSSFSANTTALRAGIDILRGPRDFLVDWIRDWDDLRQKTVTALNSIPGVNCGLPEAGTYCLANVASLGTGEEISKVLMERAGVLVTPGNYYGPSGNKYIRVCYGRTLPDKVEKGLERIVTTLKNL